MPTTQNRDTLSALIEQSGLLESARLVVYRRRGDGGEGSVELARALVRDRLLTPFQARQLLRGKHRGFFLTEKYKVLDELGEGGMGRVLLCEHLLLQKLVAVKMLHPDWADAPGAEERFLREARAAAAVDHPNVVRIHDVDRAAGGLPFMVMEHVDGTNLHQLVAAHGPLTPEQAAEFTRQAAVGLGAAHAAGLVHRDIKPGNMLLDRSGVVKLLDLGLARFRSDSARNLNLTAQFDLGNVLGTLDFIAPEQIDDSSKADVRADIYSLGYTLYYLLTGRLPFGDGSPTQKVTWQQKRDPEPLSEIRPELPAGLQAVFERMIRKNPADRYQTPAEVVAALAPLITAPVPPPPASQMPKVRPNSFVLGLSPPPTRELLAPPEPEPAPQAALAATVHTPRVIEETATTSLPRTEAIEDDPLGPMSDPTSAPAAPRSRHTHWRLIGGAVLLIACAGLAVWLLIPPKEPIAKAEPEAPPVNTPPVDQKRPVKPPEPKPPEPPKLPTGVLSPADASKKVGESVTVQFVVQSVGGKTHLHLNSQKDFRAKDNFAVTLPPDAQVGSWANAGANTFEGKTVRATGKVEKNKQGGVQLWIAEPEALEIVKE